MKVRLPLSVKISLWFFLNVIALAAVFALLFNAQFNLNLDWLLSTGARERLEAVRNLIIGELSTAPLDDWAPVLQRYSEAHRVEFALFDSQGDPLVGGFSVLPEEVRHRILGRQASGQSGPAWAETDSQDGGSNRRARSQRRGSGPPLRAIMRTTEPTRYWLLANARLENPQMGDPMRVVLIARSQSMSAGGLIFDAKPWLALALGAVVFSLLFWLPLVRGISNSLARMTLATRQIADGRFDVRINASRRDELGSLSRSIDQMAERLDGFVNGQKRFLGDIAHELCAPLAKLQLSLGILQQRTPEDQATYVKAASDKAGQIASLVTELLSFSKASFGGAAVHLQPVNVRKAAEEAMRREIADNAEIRLEVPPQLNVATDRDLLIRALANLFRNAIHYAAPAGPITVTASAEEDHVIIAVRDGGPGVPEEDLARIFDAFYRVDASRTRGTGGTGLGLAIVKACVESCLGSVTARNRQPRGLEVIIQLPSSPPPFSETKLG